MYKGNRKRNKKWLDTYCLLDGASLIIKLDGEFDADYSVRLI